MPVQKWIDGKLVAGTLEVVPSGGSPHNFRVVIRITQSPMNPIRWCFDLACGHEQWDTSKRKPTRKTMRCHSCASQVGPEHG